MLNSHAVRAIKNRRAIITQDGDYTGNSVGQVCSKIDTFRSQQNTHDAKNLADLPDVKYKGYLISLNAYGEYFVSRNNHGNWQPIPNAKFGNENNAKSYIDTLPKVTTDRKSNLHPRWRKSGDKAAIRKIKDCLMGIKKTRDAASEEQIKKDFKTKDGHGVYNVRQNLATRKVEYNYNGVWKPIEGEIKEAFDKEQFVFQRTENGFAYFIVDVPTKDTGINTGDEKIIDLGEWEVVIIDGTHLKQRLKGTERWTFALHFNQVSDDVMAKLKQKGLVRGNFFTEDAGISYDYRGYKVTDQIIKGFMIYKSGKNPNTYYAKNENGEEYEGTMEEIKKKIDAYWMKRDEDVMKQKTRDHGYTVSRIGNYKIIEGAGVDGGWWFAQEYKGKPPLETKKFKTRAQAEEHAIMSTDDSKTKDVMKQKVRDALMECMECGKKFNKNLTSSSSEVKCPKCGGYDVEVASGYSKIKVKDFIKAKFNFKKTKDKVGIGRYKGFEMYQTGSNLFSATNYSSSIVPSASFSAPSIEELKNKIDQHVDRVSRGIMTGNYDSSKTKDKKVCDDSIIVSPETGGYDISVFIKNKKVKTAWKSNKTLALQTARDLADFYRDDNGQSLNIVTKDARPKHPRWCIKDDKLFKLKSAVKKMKDAVNHMGERSFQTYEAWKRACKQMNPSVQFEGNKDICQAKPGIGEWDGAKGIIYNKDTYTKGGDSIGAFSKGELETTDDLFYKGVYYKPQELHALLVKEGMTKKLNELTESEKRDRKGNAWPLYESNGGVFAVVN